ncbi:NADH-quinone oxidoreductase subunit C [Streptomyces sp. NPDC050848]|uniref:NADH-quinone oxidoreductase subunit C n=1 Tax=Streptomyces sp. NPDC050848 TaxID=3155791 RepID=UPI0033D6FFE5
MTGNAYDTLPEAVTEVFGEEATAERAYDLLTVDVPIGSWTAALEIARDKLGCTYFDWLSAVDEPGVGFRVCAHVVALEGGAVRRLLVRTTVSHEAPVLPTAIPVYAGAEWHERETHEMFGVAFTDHPNLVPLLLPENFEGHPLRKDFVLAARVAKAWPGAKEPGESDHGGPKRRQMLPPGVPDPNDWGPMKGQLPPAPARPARTPRAAGAAGAGGAAGAARGAGAGAGAGAGSAVERPARRARTAAGGSASQAPEVPTPETPTRETPTPETPTPETPTPETPAPEATAPARPPRRSRSAADGSASQAAPGAEAESAPPPRPRSSDAPWHHARPAFDDGAAPAPEADAEAPKAAPAPEPTDTGSGTEPTETETGEAGEPDTDPTHPAGGDPA